MALYVPAFVGERASLLHLDSASSTTLLFARDATGWVSDYARATVGCETLSLPGYGGLGVLPDVEGRPVVGMMGADWLTAAPTLLDVDRGQLVRRPRDLGAVDGGVTVPYQLLGGKYLLDVTFDGKPVRVILDTGAGHTVFVDPTPRPGETEIVTEDALGNPLVLHQGTIELAVGGRSKVVTLLRATRFEILEQISAQLGVPIDGLIGLSALRAFYTDHARGVLTLAM